MGFVIPMLMALMLAMSAMAVLGFVVLRESNLMAVFYEDTHEQQQR